MSLRAPLLTYERNIGPERISLSFHVACVRSGRPRLPTFSAARPVAIAQEPQLSYHDFGYLPRFALSVVVFTRLLAAFDEDQLPLRHVLACDLPDLFQETPRNHSTRSFFSSSRVLNDSSTASEKLATGLPRVVNFNSASPAEQPLIWRHIRHIQTPLVIPPATA
jgi:hypothetical protein